MTPKWGMTLSCTFIINHPHLSRNVPVSGVRVIILYPFPKSMVMNLGSKKPSARKLKELSQWCKNLHHVEGDWVLKWDLASLRAYYINHLLYHEVGHHVDWYNRYWSAANGKKLEDFADQYAIEKTATATQVFNRLQKAENSIE
jgi:hypothetical protein